MTEPFDRKTHKKMRFARVDQWRDTLIEASRATSEFPAFGRAGDLTTELAVDDIATSPLFAAIASLPAMSAQKWLSDPMSGTTLAAVLHQVAYAFLELTTAMPREMQPTKSELPLDIPLAGLYFNDSSDDSDGLKRPENSIETLAEQIDRVEAKRGQLEHTFVMFDSTNSTRTSFLNALINVAMTPDNPSVVVIKSYQLLQRKQSQLDTGTINRPLIVKMTASFDAVGNYRGVSMEQPMVSADAVAGESYYVLIDTLVNDLISLRSEQTTRKRTVDNYAMQLSRTLTGQNDRAEFFLTYYRLQDTELRKDRVFNRIMGYLGMGTFVTRLVEAEFENLPSNAESDRDTIDRLERQIMEKFFELTPLDQLQGVWMQTLYDNFWLDLIRIELRQAIVQEREGRDSEAELMRDRERLNEPLSMSEDDS